MKLMLGSKYRAWADCQATVWSRVGWRRNWGVSEPGGRQNEGERGLVWQYEHAAESYPSPVHPWPCTSIITGIVLKSSIGSVEVFPKLP